MNNKLNFFDWYEAKEKLPHEEHDTEWIEDFARNGAWKSYRDGTSIHDGDCLKRPYTCSLCELTDALVEYRDYYLDREFI